MALALSSPPSRRLAAQQPAATAPELNRIEGTDPDNHVVYLRILLPGVPVSATPLQPGPLEPPALTAQCTRQPGGKLGFELFANFGGIEDHAYHRPWMPKDGGLFAPQSRKVLLTMEFLGYTHVKPVKRQWERLDRPAGELRYSPPATGSGNMEEISYHLQYLKALPTLRLTLDGSSVEFVTTPLLKRLALEPLCHASGL